MSKTRRTNPPFTFAPGQSAQPSEMQGGIVLFEDVNGDPAWATRPLCQAYGYIWDEQNQVCRAFIENPNVIDIGKQTTNNVKGNNNEIRESVNATTISGQNNLMIGKNTSVNVVGDRNQVETKISNSTIVGTFANATANNSLVIGGNSSQNTIDDKTGRPIFKDILGKRQLTKILFGNQFEEETKSNYLWMNNVEGSAYPIPKDAVLMFEADVLGVVISPSASAGEFESFKIAGVTMKKTSGEGGTPIYARTSLLNSSSSLRLGCVASIYTDSLGERFLTIEVTNAKGMTIEWVASMEITQLQTNGI